MKSNFESNFRVHQESWTSGAERAFANTSADIHSNSSRLGLFGFGGPADKPAAVRAVALAG